MEMMSAREMLDLSYRIMGKCLKRAEELLWECRGTRRELNALRIAMSIAMNVRKALKDSKPEDDPTYRELQREAEERYAGIEINSGVAGPPNSHSRPREGNLPARGVRVST